MLEKIGGRAYKVREVDLYLVSCYGPLFVSANASGLWFPERRVRKYKVEAVCRELLSELSSLRWELRMGTLGWEERKSNARREVLWDLEALQTRMKREPRLSLNLTTSSSAYPGEAIWAKVLLLNEGDGKAEGIRLFFEAPLILEPLTASEIRVEELPPGQSREFEVGFRVQNDAPPATYPFTARGTYQDPLERKVDMGAISAPLIVQAEEVSLREAILLRLLQILF